MAQINFPTATSNGQTFEADNGVIYTYVGTPPNGFWSGSFQATGLTTLDARFLKLDSSNDPVTGGLNITGGNVGIGTSSPSFILETEQSNPGGSAIGAGIKNNSSDAGTSVKFSLAPSNAGGGIRAAELEAHNDGVNGISLGFNTSNGSTPTEQMRISSVGNVGIGTNDPDNYAGGSTLALVGSNGARLGFNAIGRKYYIGGDAGDRLEIGRRISSDTADSPGIVLNGNGSVGIGTTSPNGALEIQTAASEGVLFDSAGNSQQPRITLMRSGGANYSLTNALGQLVLQRDSGEIYRHLNTNNTHRFVGTGQFNRPSNWWSSNAFFGLPGLGHFGTEGSYRTTITSNGYRGTSGWVSLGANGNTGAAQIGLDPIGKIFFGCQQNKPNGQSGGVTVRTMMDVHGDLMIHQTSTHTPGLGNTITGAAVERSTSGTTAGSTLYVSRNAVAAQFNRNSNGDIVQFRRNGAEQGDIRVSGSTVTYAGGHLARFAQLEDNGDRIEILRGSVLSNIDQMCVWDYDAKDPEFWTEDDEIPEGSNVGDVKIEGREAGTELNEQLNRMKVSDVEGDPNVSGVFEDWDDDDQIYTKDFFCAMTGDFVIRIAQGTTVARGDLLMSAGDGTAKPQEDDIVRSKTIAKVSSTVITETYADGSYIVPCVLMAC